MRKLPYSLSIKIFRLISQLVSHNTFDFIVITFNVCASPEIFSRDQTRESLKGQGLGCEGMKEQFPSQVVDGLHRLDCCVRPCIVMMQDDSFRLMTPAFVFMSFLRLFFVLVTCVCSSCLLFSKHVASHTVNILL